MLGRGSAFLWGCVQGHCYRSRTGTLERWYKPKWWDLDYMPTAPANLTAIHDSLVAAVVKRLMSDAPLGVLLSGGLDSSLVASIAVRWDPKPARSAFAGFTGFTHQATWQRMSIF